MKRMISLTAGVLFLGLLFTGGQAVSAEVSRDPEDSLIVWYDFEGETPEERLLDKAPAGTTKENLTLFTTETDGIADSRVEDGRAYISRKAENYLISDFTSGSGSTMGGDLLTIDGKMTVYTVFRAIGKGSYVDPIDVNHYMRTLLKQPTASGATMEVRFGEAYDREEKYVFDPTDGILLWEKDIVHCAVTVEYDRDAGTLIGKTYLSYDGGKNFRESEKRFPVAEDPFATCEYLMLGKLGAAAKKDKGTDFEISEFRIYNDVLTALEVVQVKHPEITSLPGADTSTDSAGADTGIPTPLFPEESKQDTTPAGTAAPKPTQSGSGCASSLSSGISLSVVGMLAAIELLRKRQKNAPENRKEKHT